MFIDIIKTSQISAIQLKSFCELSKVTKPLINRSVFIALFCFHKIRCFQQTDPIIVQGSCSPCMPSIHHMMLMTEKHHIIERYIGLCIHLCCCALCVSSLSARNSAQRANDGHGVSHQKNVVVAVDKLLALREPVSKQSLLYV